jgi:large subunit ribosomal protein L23
VRIILEQPVVSEKAAGLKEEKNVYTFKVAKFANKHQIAKAVEAMFGVTPVLVRTMGVKGKKLPLNKWRKLQHKADWKKAYVTLKEGEKIKELK